MKVNFNLGKWNGDIELSSIEIVSISLVIIGGLITTIWV